MKYYLRCQKCRKEMVRTDTTKPCKRCKGVMLVTGVVLALCAAMPAKASPLSDCQPIVKASGYPVGPDWTDGAVGRHVFFFCAAPASEYTVGFSCRYDDCNAAQLSASIAKVATATDKTAAINAEWAAWVKWDCTNPPDEPKRLLCVERSTLEQTAMTKALVGYTRPVWRVKSNGTSTTRPAYSLINGVLGTKEVRRATVGTLCDLTKPSVPATGGDMRAEFGVSGVVTICSKATR
jgi:hypothetical protein